MKKRNESVDIAKGLGMILVIVGHCVLFGGKIHNFIFAFHMPLFFILSGLFISKKPLGAVVKSKIQSLVKPYLIYCFLGILVTCIVPSQRSQLNFDTILSDIYLGCPEHIGVSSIWFLCTLFVTLIMFCCILRIERKFIQFFVICILLIIGGIFGWGFQKGLYRGILPFERLPIGIDVMFVAIFFVAVGYYGKDKIFEFIEYFKRLKLNFRCLVLLGGGIIYIIGVLYNGRVNSHGLTYNNFIVYLLEAIVGSLILIGCSVLIETELKGLKKILIYCGQHSVVMLGIQAILVRGYIFIANRMFKTDFALYGLTGYQQWLATITVFCGTIMFCILVDICKKFVNTFWKNKIRRE